MEKIKSWITPVGTCVLVVLAALIKMDTADCCKAKKHGMKRSFMEVKEHKGMRNHRWDSSRRGAMKRMEEFKKMRDNKQKRSHRTPK